MKNFVRLTALFGIALCGFATHLLAADYSEIATEEVKRLLERDKEAMLIFPLSRIEYDEKHIPGAVHIPLAEIKNKLPEDRNTRLIVYSRGLNTSIRAAEIASKLGYKRVYVYKEGIQGWISAKYPTESTLELPDGLIETMTTDELLNESNNSEDIVVLDCSLPAEVEKVKIDVSNKIYIPLEELHTRYTELPKDQKIAIICISGTRSLTAARYLISKGFPSVASVTGGTIKWIAEKKPVIFVEGDSIN